MRRRFVGFLGRIDRRCILDEERGDRDDCRYDVRAGALLAVLMGFADSR